MFFKPNAASKPGVKLVAAAAAGVSAIGLASLGSHSAQPSAPVHPGTSPSNHTTVNNHPGQQDTFQLGDGRTVRIKGLGDESSSAATKPKPPHATPAKPVVHNQLTSLKKGQRFYDVSKWQGEINFAALHKQGVRQIIMRGMWGTSKDTMVEHNWREAVRHGITPTLYTWVVPNKSAASQAHAIVALKKHLEAKYPPPKKSTIMFDVEDNVNGRGMSRAARVAQLEREIHAVARLTNQKPSSMIIYTGSWVWNPLYGSAGGKFGPKGMNLNVIDSNYNYSPGDPIRSIPWPTGLGQPDAIQYTSSSHNRAIPQNSVDRNVVITPFHG